MNKDSDYYMGLGVAWGVVFGSAIGALGNTGAGLALGIALGAAIGYFVAQQKEKENQINQETGFGRRPRRFSLKNFKNS